MTRSVVVVASWTARPLELPLRDTLRAATGDDATIRFADANQLFQICLQPEAHHLAEADEIVVLWRLEDVFERDLLEWAEGADDAEQRLLDGCRQLGAAVAGLAGRIGAPLTVGDAPVPVGYGLDHLDTAALGRLLALTTAANAAFRSECPPTLATPVDVMALQVAHGTARVHDAASWLLYRQPFTGEFNRVLGAEVGTRIAHRTRATPKVLVLDCDNTLWGGIVGDDGIGGLECSDAFPGNAFRQFQYVARRLQRQGVLLALASRNADESVVQAFEQLDGMVLRLADVATRRVNWEPKPGNIADIARELNLGLDSFVFVDDSHHELASVRAELPDVRCLQVPEDLELLPQLLADSGLFRHLAVTADDRERSVRVQQEAGRVAAAGSMSHDEFLASLDLRLRWFEVDESTVARVTQLINKTNQFNVTTIRRTEAEVRRLLDDPAHVVRAAEVSDRFGDYGLVVVAIARCDTSAAGEATAEIDSLLMSCRVLGRGVETAFIATLVDELRGRGCTTIAARYVPTAKNQLVQQLFPEHGFTATGDGAFTLAADATVSAPRHITVVRD